MPTVCKTCGGTDHSRRTSKRCKGKVRTEEVQTLDLDNVGPNRLSSLAVELKHAIAHMLDIGSIVNLSLVDRTWKASLCNDAFWKAACRRRGLAKPNGPKYDRITYETFLLSALVGRCVKCRRAGAIPSVLLDSLRLCRACDRGMSKITITKAKTEYKLNEHDLESLPRVYGPNPRYKTASPMILFLLEDVTLRAHEKHGGSAGLLLAQNKSRKRSTAIANTKLRKRAERKRELETALEEKGIVWRDDSVLCSNYVDGRTDKSIEQIVAVMERMHVLYEHSPYKAILDVKMQATRDEMRGEWLSRDERQAYFDDTREEAKETAELVFQETIQRHASVLTTFPVCRCGRPLLPANLLSGE